MKPGLPYEVTHGCALVRCKRCQTTQSFPLGNGHNPERTTKLITRNGWIVGRWNPNQNLCPACAELNVFGRAGESGKKEPMNKPLTALNIEQKAAARRVLDAHFDDKDGCYLDGWTDEKLAQEIGVPRATLAEYRELAYGPILKDPAADALRDELAAAKKAAADVANILGAINETIATVERKMGELRKKLNLPA